METKNISKKELNLNLSGTTKSVLPPTRKSTNSDQDTHHPFRCARWHYETRNRCEQLKLKIKRRKEKLQKDKVAAHVFLLFMSMYQLLQKKKQKNEYFEKDRNGISILYFSVAFLLFQNSDKLYSGCRYICFRSFIPK